MRKGNRSAEKQADIQLQERIAAMSTEEAVAELAAMGIEFDPEDFARRVRNRIAQIDLDNARKEREAFLKGRSLLGGARGRFGSDAVPSLAFYHKKLEEDDSSDDAGKEEDAEVLAALAEAKRSSKADPDDSDENDAC